METKKKMKLAIQAFVKFFAGFAMIALMLFLTAGTVHYTNGWLFMGLLMIPMVIVGIVLLVKSPELLEKRLNFKEKESEQKGVIRLSGLMFICGFIAAGLDYRFQVFPLPTWIVAVASVLFVISYLLYGEVLRENAYLSRTVEVQENQKVIDTGLYGIVRHPMYSVTVLMFLSMPLVLGSLISFVIFLVYPILMAKRIKNEEEVLEQNLEGYSEYKKRVRYKMIPFVW